MVTRAAGDARPSIVWFRQDLRLSDNPALTAAANAGPLIPVYILDDETPGAWKPGGASRWWLHHSLVSLSADLEKRGSKLILRRGDANAVLTQIIAETNAQSVCWNRLYEPFAVARDTVIKTSLAERKVSAHSFNGSLLVEPWAIETGSDGPFKVFTPFWKSACKLIEDTSPAPPPKQMAAPPSWPGSEALASWNLLPARPNWATGIAATWRPGESGARKRLAAFLDQAIQGYASDRNRPDMPGTSRLSPHLHWGEIGPRQIWHAISNLTERNPSIEGQATTFLSEIGWREFSHHLLFHFPQITARNFKPAFDRFPWQDSDTLFDAWCRGRTGYPIVDAGMRELWATGYMHNRVRMVAASFLVKHLLIPWPRGAKWFWDTLVDADLANNAASWQWVAGSGADAAPFFRIFNPVIQGEKFDPEGKYVRQWVPELERCGTRQIHKPWTASNFASLAYYPPIVDHDRARARALDAFKNLSAPA